MKTVQHLIELCYNTEVEKVELQSRTDEIDTSEKVRIYTNELHRKYIKKSSILKLETTDGVFEGHSACAQFHEDSVGELLLHPTALDLDAQSILLNEVEKVFTEADKEMLTALPD